MLTRKAAAGLVALGLIGGVGRLGVACGPPAPVYDTSVPGAPCDRGFAECSEDSDCYYGFVYELGTFCIDGYCKCPNDGDIICNGKNHPPDDNQRGCRNPRDCEPGEVCFDGGVPEEEPDAGGGAGADAAPPPPPPECTEADVSTCAGPPDKRCGEATCVEGKCALKITPGPIASQKAGDCKRSVCTFEGAVADEEDTSDYYDDGEECTYDMCIDKVSTPVPIQKIICPDTGEGYCSQGKCVQCVDNDDCKGNEFCAMAVGRCVLSTCYDGILNGSETDVDCGGECLLCGSGDSCMLDSDCKSNVCKNLKCVAPSCADGQKNDGETGTDCGEACKDPEKLCGDGQGCETGADCQSGVCWSAKCQVPLCTDGVKNAKETAIDCGGDCGDCL